VSNQAKLFLGKLLILVGLHELAPQAGLEPATLRLTETPDDPPSETKRDEREDDQ
jgi:hypothetical protein